MPTVLIIDDDATSRAYVREQAPPDWLLLEASDGLTGIDLVREHYRTLALVILDMELPDIEGRTICLRLREYRQDLPILPFTGFASTGPALADLGCLPPIFKPVRPAQLADRLRSVGEEHAAPMTPNPVLSLAQEQSQLIERLTRRQHVAPAVIVYARSALRRNGLAACLAAVATASSAASLPALELLLRRSTWVAIVADALAASEITAAATEHRVPLVLIAADAVQAQTVSSAEVSSVLIELDPAFEQHVSDVVLAIASHAPIPRFAPVTSAATPGKHIAPPSFVQRFADTRLSLRELDILWLDHQGLSQEQSAATLDITPITVTSHWRNIGSKLGQTRQEVKAWVRAVMAEDR